MARVDHLSYKYENFELNIPSWEFPDEGITCIFGPSGSGKSTLLQILAGLLPCQHNFEVKGESVSSKSLREKNVGFVFQDYALFPHMSLWENLKFAGLARGLEDSDWTKTAEDLISRLNLRPLRNQRTSTLSGGEQQRGALARALVAHPKVVLLDEPFSNLDPLNRDNARSLLQELSSDLKIPFVMVTHNFEDVRLLSKSLLVLNFGRVVGLGETKTLLKRPTTLELAQAFPENQFIPKSPDMGLSWTHEVSHKGNDEGDVIAAKNWDFSVTDVSTARALPVEVLKRWDVGPFFECLARLSSGQILKAVAPLSLNFGRPLFVQYSPDSLTLFKGTKGS